MASPLQTGKQSVNLAASGARVSKIRRDPPPVVKTIVVRERDERDARIVVIGVVTFALANVGRSSAAAIGMLLGYLVIFEGFLAGVWTGLLPWLLVRAATAAVSQVPIFDETASATFGPDGTLIEVGGQGILLSVLGAWFLIAGYAIVLLAAALALFRARDVS